MRSVSNSPSSDDYDVSPNINFSFGPNQPNQAQIMDNNLCAEVIQKWKLLDLSRPGLFKKAQFSDDSDENSSLSLNVLNPE